MSPRPIHTDDAPQPAGHYSQGVVHAGLVYVAGQLPIDPMTGAIMGDHAEAQTDQVIRNAEAILRAAGSGLDLVVSLTVFVVSRDDWPGVDAACARRFGAHRPARAVVGGADLKPGCRVEITLIAALRPE
jgi:reactive intermediate/imine deaminase